MVWRFVHIMCLCSLLLVPQLANALQAIDKPVATPNALFSNQETQSPVLVTVQVSVDPALIPTSINLVRLDETGRITNIIGRMYDDGTQGDVLKGDGTFSRLVLLNEAAPGKVHLAVTAGYRNTLIRKQSPVVDVAIAAPVTIQDAAEVSTVGNLATNYFLQQSAEIGPDSARLKTVVFLNSQPGVVRAGISDDGHTIWVLFRSGLDAVIVTNPLGSKATTTAAINATVNFTGNGQALVLAPFLSEFLAGDESNDILTKLQQFWGSTSQATLLSNGQVTVDSFRLLRQYGVVSISTHGVVDGNGQVILLTREQVTLVSRALHLLDWALGRVTSAFSAGVGGQAVNVWSIRPSFISANAGGGFPGTLVYASACNSTANSSLADAFIMSGAKAYLGYSKNVCTPFSFSVGTQLFDQLADKNLQPEDRTVGKAFNGIPNKVDPGGCGSSGAVFQLGAGSDSNLAILDDLVRNGGFETGDLTGWMATGPGYEKASIDDKTAGKYAVRLGRWDQPYSGFGGFRGPSVPGVEPAGRDGIHQDISLPATATQITLSFNYNVVTYDGADYDWFDMQVLDADTGQIIAQPVSQEGGIIAGSTANWGLFYTTGWRNVSLDLTAFSGRNIRLSFGVTQDGFGDQIATYLDQISVKAK